MKKQTAKRLNRDKLIADLKLIAAGANGGMVELIEDFPHIAHAVWPDAMGRLAYAVESIWFCGEKTLSLFGMSDSEKWSTFETLADAIIAERKRLDSIKGEPT